MAKLDLPTDANVLGVMAIELIQTNGTSLDAAFLQEVQRQSGATLFSVKKLELAKEMTKNYKRTHSPEEWARVMWVYQAIVQAEDDYISIRASYRRATSEEMKQWSETHKAPLNPLAVGDRKQYLNELQEMKEADWRAQVHQAGIAALREMGLGL